MNIAILFYQFKIFSSSKYTDVVKRMIPFALRYFKIRLRQGFRQPCFCWCTLQAQMEATFRWLFFLVYCTYKATKSYGYVGYPLVRLSLFACKWVCYNKFFDVLVCFCMLCSLVKVLAHHLWVQLFESTFFLQINRLNKSIY